MKAKEKAICSICGNEIIPGQEIGWVRRGEHAGHKFHASCHVSPVTASTEVSKPTKPVRSSISSTLSSLRKNSPWWDVLAHSMQHLSRALLIGPPGTGKSTTALKTCNINYRVTMTESTTREDLIGMFHLIAGETKWVDGPIVQAMRAGEPVLIDEIDRYSQEVASMLYSVLDDAPHVDLPNGEIVHAKPGYKVLMTSNETPDMLPAAIFDRIEGFFIATTPHEDAIKHLTQTDAEVVRNFYSLQPKPVIKTVPTVRRMRAFHTLKSNGLVNHAASIVFASSAKEIESAIANVESSRFLGKSE